MLKIDRDKNNRTMLIFLFENDFNIYEELKNISSSAR